MSRREYGLRVQLASILVRNHFLKIINLKLLSEERLILVIDAHGIFHGLNIDSFLLVFGHFLAKFAPERHRATLLFACPLVKYLEKSVHTNLRIDTILLA